MWNVFCFSLFFCFKSSHFDGGGWCNCEKRSLQFILFFSIYRHIPKAKATAIAETPEMKRIAENTKLQSNVNYHADFEKAKGKLTQVSPTRRDDVSQYQINRKFFLNFRSLTILRRWESSKTRRTFPMFHIMAIFRRRPRWNDNASWQKLLTTEVRHRRRIYSN